MENLLFFFFFFFFQRGCTLYSCLMKLTEPELLSEVVCTKCSSNRDGTECKRTFSRRMSLSKVHPSATPAKESENPIFLLFFLIQLSFCSPTRVFPTIQINLWRSEFLLNWHSKYNAIHASIHSSTLSFLQFSPVGLLL